MINRLKQINDLSIIEPKGAFYIMICIDKYYNKSINNEKIKSSLDFSKSILEEEKVAVIPGVAFGLDNYIRLSYATSMEIIEEGLNRLERYLKKLK
jgi:aspartate aminotransferase